MSNHMIDTVAWKRNYDRFRLIYAYMNLLKMNDIML